MRFAPRKFLILIVITVDAFSAAANKHLLVSRLFAVTVSVI